MARAQGLKGHQKNYEQFWFFFFFSCFQIQVVGVEDVQQWVPLVVANSGTLIHGAA
jgi:hypothetical protein